jgi:hypothetical protein
VRTATVGTDATRSIPAPAHDHRSGLALPAQVRVGRAPGHGAFPRPPPLNPGTACTLPATAPAQPGHACTLPATAPAQPGHRLRPSRDRPRPGRAPLAPFPSPGTSFPVTGTPRPVHAHGRAGRGCDATRSPVSPERPREGRDSFTRQPGAAAGAAQLVYPSVPPGHPSAPTRERHRGFPAPHRAHLPWPNGASGGDTGRNSRSRGTPSGLGSSRGAASSPRRPVGHGPARAEPSERSESRRSEALRVNRVTT